MSDINNKVLDIKNLKVYYQEKGPFGLQNKLLKQLMIFLYQSMQEAAIVGFGNHDCESYNGFN